MLYVPAGAEAVVDTVRVAFGNALPPFAVKVAGMKLAVAPAGRPDDTERPVDRSVPCPGSRDRECCAARCAVGKRAGLGTHSDRTDARSICKLNIRLHRGLGADSTDAEIRAELHQLDYEVGINDKRTRLRRRSQCCRRSTPRSYRQPRKGKRSR